MRPRKIWYSVSVFFSVQYRNWESDQRTFKVGFNPFHQKIVWYITGWTELETHGNGRDIIPAGLHRALEEDYCHMAFTENTVRRSVRYWGEKPYKIKISAHKEWKQQVKKALETTHLSLLYDTYICSEKLSQPAFITVTKWQCLCSAKTRNKCGYKFKHCILRF